MDSSSGRFYQITRAFSQFMFAGTPASLVFSGKIHRSIL